MPRINLWSQSAPRVEIDQRSRDARLRFERTDELYRLPVIPRCGRVNRGAYHV
jgi:hypothetical protein